MVIGSLCIIIVYNYWLWKRSLSGFINPRKCLIHWAFRE